MIDWPKSLVREIAARRCVFFLGSGISATATQAKLLDTANKLQQTSVEKSKLDMSLREETATKVSCETSNQRLVQYNKEILAHYEDKGMMDSMLQTDKVAGLKSVEIENILQEYQDKVEDEHVQ